MSPRMSELERAVHVERESLREEIKGRHEVSRSEKRLKERRDEQLAKNRGGLRNRGANSGELNREPRVNFDEQANRRRKYGSTRGRGSSSSIPQGIIGRGAQTSEEVLLATDRPRMNDRRETQIRLGDVTQQAGVMRIKEEVKHRTVGKIRNLYRRETTLRRGVRVMQRQ